MRLSSEDCREELLVTILAKSLASSANNFSTALPSQTFTISLIKIINNIGPKTEPCGTPLRTVLTLENIFSSTTHWTRLEIKPDIHFNRLPEIPYNSSLNRSFAKTIESNARAKSM
jgi:hypothetical protein